MVEDSVEINDNPKRIIHMAILGMKEEVLSSEFVWLCASCNMCYERCPQDIRFTEIIHAIRNIAIREIKQKKINIQNNKIVFDKLFVDNIRRYGRIFEPELIMRFLLSRFNIKTLLSYIPLGCRMMLKGKLPLFPRMIRGIRQIRRIINLK
jgi:heterodisulfide reductase subunit C